MWWGCRCLRLVVWFVAGAHVTEIRGLVSYRWCDGLIFVAGLAARGVHISRLFLAHCSWNHHVLCLDSVSAACWQRIEQEPNLPQMRSQEWPTRSDIQFMGDPETQIFVPLVAQTIAKYNAIVTDCSRVWKTWLHIECVSNALIMHIELFLYWFSSNCVSSQT